MTLVGDCHDDELGCCSVGVAPAGDSTGAFHLAVLGSNVLCSLGRPASNCDLMTGCGEASGQATALRTRPAEDSDLHPANVLAPPERGPFVVRAAGLPGCRAPRAPAVGEAGRPS